MRSMKLHLKRTVGNACLTVAEMTTVLTQVEAILNSRPITPISDDPADLRALTPGHFLIGENLMAYPESNLQDISLNKLSRWQHMEQNSTSGPDGRRNICRLVNKEANGDRTPIPNCKSVN